MVWIVNYRNDERMAFSHHRRWRDFWSIYRGGKNWPSSLRLRISETAICENYEKARLPSARALRS
jgi:hypothetical protein